MPLLDKLAAPLRTLAPGRKCSASRFEPVEDAATGVVSHVLRTELAEVVQSFYFVNSGFSDNAQTLWCYASDRKGRSLAVIDFASGEFRLVPGTEFLDASPLVEPGSGDVLWISGTSLYRRPAAAHGDIRCMGSLPEEWVRNETPHRVSTHLTFRADGAALSLDAQFPRRWFAGEILLSDATANVWRQFDRCYNHAQFNPVDSDLLLIAQDGWTDPQSKRNIDYEQRLWLLQRGGGCEPLYHESTPLHGHEWWDSEGRHVWFVHYGAGIKRVDIETRQEELVWAGKYSHAHASADGRYVVVDAEASGVSPRCRVLFLNRDTGKSLQIADHSWVGDPDLWRCHVHPHPRFVLMDRWIHYTTYAHGRISLALTAVDDLIHATS